MSNIGEIRHYIDQMIEQSFDQTSFYSEKAKIISVDEAAGTCTVKLAADDAEITGVAFKTAKNDAEGIFITPEVNSYVMISWLNNQVCFVSLVQRWSKITMKKGSNSFVLDGTDVIQNAGTKTVALAPDVKDRLVIVENILKDLIAAINLWVPTANDGGGALKTALTTWLTTVVVNTTESDINAPNFKAKD